MGRSVCKHTVDTFENLDISSVEIYSKLKKSSSNESVVDRSVHTPYKKIWHKFDFENWMSLWLLPIIRFNKFSNSLREEYTILDFSLSLLLRSLSLCRSALSTSLLTEENSMADLTMDEEQSLRECEAYVQMHDIQKILKVLIFFIITFVPFFNLTLSTYYDTWRDYLVYYFVKY